MTSITEVRSASTLLFAGTWCPLVSVMTTLNYVASIFHCRAWYRALSLRYACIQSLGIILIPYVSFVPNFFSFATSIVEVAHGDKLCTQVNHSLTHRAYLMPRELKHLCFEITVRS